VRRLKRKNYIGPLLYHEFLSKKIQCSEAAISRLFNFTSGTLEYRYKNESIDVERISKLHHSAKVAFTYNLLDKMAFPMHDLLVGHDRDGMKEPQKNGG
jgi:hypothetical protein